MGRIIVTEFAAHAASSRTRAEPRTSSAQAGASRSVAEDEGDQLKLDETMCVRGSAAGAETDEGLAKAWRQGRRMR